jgi:sulfur-oxidizing protein SoxY
VVEAPAALLVLRAPPRAADAAVVPIAVEMHPEAVGAARVVAVTLIADRNPSPVAAVLRFGTGARAGQIETRLRIEEPTMLRAVAELDDGRLYTTARHIKAAGGCSAPVGTAEPGDTVGRMRLVAERDDAGHPTGQLLVAVRHPNVSGLAMDQVTRLYAPAWYVRHLVVALDDVVVLEAEIDFSLSENPTVRFTTDLPTDGRTLRATAVDTREQAFTTRVDLRSVAQPSAPTDPDTLR